MLEAKLVVVGGDAKSAEVRLKLPTVIGRGKEANLTVPHALVSRRHTEIFEKEGRLFVRDMGSLNGTFVNNKKIEGETLLDPNQLLTLGNITFRAVYKVEAADDKTVPDDETVTFDEVKTEVSTEVGKVALKTPAGKVDFSETVPVDELKASAASKETPAPVAEPVKNSSAEKVKSKTKSPEEKKPTAPKETEEPVFETDASSGEADTDKSFKTEGDDESISSIFAFEEAEGNASKSIAVNALDDLPSAQPAAVSFVAKVDFGDDAPSAASQVDPIEIDLGEEKKPASQDDDDSGLGSFLKKLPR